MAHRTARKQNTAKKMYVPKPADSRRGGVMIATMKLESQMVAVDTATPFERMDVGKTSAGKAHPSGEYEAPKKRMKRKAKAMQTHPAVLWDNQLSS